VNKLISIVLCLCLMLSFAACGGESVSEAPEAVPTAEPTPESTPVPTLEPIVDEAALALDLGDAQWELSADGSYYQLQGVAFCTNVVEEKYQTMNIYAPAAYFEGGEVCGYTAETAPIVLQNNCSGWRSGSAGPVDKTMIENGFVFVNCGARSRDAGGYGKAPTPVVDLKSAVRTLRLNGDIIPGDEEKIISIGTSGGGQMSSILGASGNMEEYYSYLYENGAPGVLYDETNDTYISTIDDDVFGCMCYCPIADIENADIAYAWMRYDSGATSFSGMLVAAVISASSNWLCRMTLHWLSVATSIPLESSIPRARLFASMTPEPVLTTDRSLIICPMHSMLSSQQTPTPKEISAILNAQAKDPAERAAANLLPMTALRHTWLLWRMALSGL